MKFYVYILYDWQGIPRYVGAGSGNRYVASTLILPNDNSNPEKSKFLRETLNKIGHIPKRKIHTNLTREESFILETEIIQKIGRHPNGPLVNLTDGGQGPKGIQYPTNRNAKISAALKGREISSEWRAKISATLTGHIQSEETRAKKAAAGRGRKQSDETKARRSASLTGRELSPEHLANLRAAVARRPSRKGIPLSKESRANQSAGQSRSWADNRETRLQKCRATRKASIP